MSNEEETTSRPQYAGIEPFAGYSFRDLEPDYYRIATSVYNSNDANIKRQMLIQRIIVAVAYLMLMPYIILIVNNIVAMNDLYANMLHLNMIILFSIYSFKFATIPSEFIIQSPMRFDHTLRSWMIKHGADLHEPDNKRLRANYDVYIYDCGFVDFVDNKPVAVTPFAALDCNPILIDRGAMFVSKSFNSSNLIHVSDSPNILRYNPYYGDSALFVPEAMINAKPSTLAIISDLIKANSRSTSYICNDFDNITFATDNEKIATWYNSVIESIDD